MERVDDQIYLLPQTFSIGKHFCFPFCPVRIGTDAHFLGAAHGVMVLVHITYAPNHLLYYVVICNVETRANSLNNLSVLAEVVINNNLMSPG